MSEILGSKQIDALQAVDLRLAFVVHGRQALRSEVDPIAHGPAIIGISDIDYDAVEYIHAGLQPGDVSAREKIFGTFVDDIPSNHSVISGLQAPLFRSPYVATSPLNELTLYRELMESYGLTNTDPLAIQGKPELAAALQETIVTCRKLRLCSAFEYADGLALLKGARRALADSSSGHINPCDIPLEQRNRDMVCELGDIATSMASPASSKTDRTHILAFTAGRGHVGVREILDGHGIHYTHSVSRQPLGAAICKHIALSLGGDRVGRAGRWAGAAWIRNAQSYKPGY